MQDASYLRERFDNIIVLMSSIHTSTYPTAKHINTFLEVKPCSDEENILTTVLNEWLCTCMYTVIDIEFIAKLLLKHWNFTDFPRFRYHIVSN